MCYICGKSRNKIVHSSECRYVKMIPEKNRKYYKNVKDAYKDGYVNCKYCAHIKEYLAREEKNLKNICNINGVLYYFNVADGSLDVISKSGKWKIIVNGQRNFIWLYHKSKFGERKGDLVPGYHSQKVRCSTLEGYMNYIVEHDRYREDNPLYDWQKHTNSPVGSKKWKKDQRKAKKVRRSNSINYVMELLNNMSVGNLVY